MQPDIADDRIVAAVQSAINGLLAVYVFGSRARGTARPDSDLDLAILTDGTIDTVSLWTHGQDLAALFGCDVDLVDLRVASTVLQYQIISSGRRLWARDSQAALYETFILSEKIALDDARAGLIGDISREGRVYGR